MWRWPARQARIFAMARRVGRSPPKPAPARRSPAAGPRRCLAKRGAADRSYAGLSPWPAAAPAANCRDRPDRQWRRRARRRVEFADDAAALDQHDAARDIEHELEVLLDDQHRETMLLAQRRQKVADLLDDRRLDALGGLVEKRAATAAARARAPAPGSAARRPTMRPRADSEAGSGAGKIATTRSIARSSVSPESGVHARRRFSCALRPGRMPRPCGT